MIQNAFAFDKKNSTSFRQCNSSGRTLEKSSPDATFQIPNLPAQRRLRDVECLGCSSEMQVFGDCYKIAQVA
jgi:hypothetical protein